MHRIAKGILASAMALSLLGGIAAAEESYYLELPSKGITTTTRITANVPDENEVEDGINPITGEPWYGSYTPILVTIDSHPDALPHWGAGQRIRAQQQQKQHRQREGKCQRRPQREGFVLGVFHHQFRRFF